MHGFKRLEATYVLGEVAGLIALAALDALSRTRLGALLGVVALLPAILAGIRVDTSLGAVTSAVTLFLAVDALDGGLVRLVLGDLLLAVLIWRLASKIFQRGT